MAVVRVAVYVVAPFKGAFGVKVAVAPATETVPVTGTIKPRVSLKLSVVTVAGSMFSEKVAVSTLIRGAIVALFAGFVFMTVGDVVSPPPPPPPPLLQCVNIDAVKSNKRMTMNDAPRFMATPS
jgi:hypothetical protein